MTYSHKFGCPILRSLIAKGGLSTRSVDARRACILLLLATLSLTAHAQLPAGTRPPDSELGASPLSQAEDAIAARHYDEAKKLLLVITAANPKDARALYDLGFIDQAQHDKTAAEAAYRAAIAADPKNFEAHAGLGMLLINTDRAASIAELKTASTLTPAANAASAKAEVLRTLAGLYADKQPEDARGALLAAIQLTGETREDTRMTAWIAGVMGDYKDAEAIYRRMLVEVPNDPEIVYSLAALLIGEDRPNEAEPLLTAALTAHPEYTPNKAQLARIYALRGDTDKAIVILEAEHTQNPSDDNTKRFLADVYNRGGRPADADLLYQQLLAKKPDNIALLSARGDSLIRQKKPAEAEAVLQKADALFLANPAALPDTDDRVELTGALAFAASGNDQPTVVLAALDQRALYAAETPPTLFLRATAHDHLHHLALARGFYTQFIAAAGDKYPNETWEAKHRLIALKTDK